MELLQQLKHLPAIVVDIARLSVWLLLLMAIFVPLERLFSAHPQRILRKSFFVDLGYYFLNSLLPKMLLVLPMAMIAWALHRLVPGEWQAWVASMPLKFRLAGALVVGELGFYWGHRWTHEIPFLWRFHVVHHSAEEVDWLVNTRAHPLDIVFVRLCGFVPMYALGLAQPMAGKSVDVVPLLIMLIATLWGFFIHSNIRWRFGWLSLLVSTPAFHHWHHTNDENVNKNYASMFPWMDKLFGTWYLPGKLWPTKYGTNTALPGDIPRQLVYPILPPGRGTAVEGSLAGASDTGVG